MAGSESYHVFDTDLPNGGLAGYFPTNSELIDLSKTQGQVRLFDTILSNPELDYVLELDASVLASFFRIYTDIAFEQAASEVRLSISVYFILDRGVTSVDAAKNVSGMLDRAELHIVRNEIFGNVLAFPEAAKTYSEIKKTSGITLPRLSVETLNYIDQIDFTFADFILKNGASVPNGIRLELWMFLETIYNQQDTPNRN